MSDAAEGHPLTLKTVRCSLPGLDAVTVRSDVPYHSSDAALTMDVYCGSQQQSQPPRPVVVFVGAYPDVGVPNAFGCRFKEFGMTVSWARLLAASGLAAIVYTTRDPATDIHAVLEHVRKNAGPLGVDAGRIGLLAASANAVVALSAIMRDKDLTCAGLLYGITLDAGESTAVAEMSRAYGFANACAGRSIDDLPSGIPLLVVRAGRDQFPGLNEALDTFVAGALARNLPLMLINHASGAHAFDLDEDTDASRHIVRQTLDFFRFHLGRGASAS